jgi:3D-(3,5/4)-trihydroxycyclohexane-1,2-dione acylhydrolase (decyclizing)
MGLVRLTAAQAAVRYLKAQQVEVDGARLPYFAGVWAIFGHGNVAGLGEALHAARQELPTYRAHNEQSMAHAAIAYAKQMRRRRAMICTTSIGPGATNLVTAAALAHVNRLPVLFMPGDVYANREPDPVLQQLEDFADGTVSANDTLRPVSRYFDRIQRPEQLLAALPRAMATLTDPAACGPVTLAMCQDVQAEAHAFPEDFFETRFWRPRRQPCDPTELAELARLIRGASAPLIVAGGGVLYSQAEAALADFARDTGIPVGETQAGKGALPWGHPCALGGIGVTGTSAANAAAAAADLVIGIGTRLQDFTTASRTLFANPNARLAQVNVAAFDAHKHGSLAVVGDARAVIEALQTAVAGYRVPAAWEGRCSEALTEWNAASDAATAAASGGLPTDAQVIGAVQRAAGDTSVVVAAAGGLPGELHRLWRPADGDAYHLEYGYSCMGYEVAGGLGVKLAQPDRDVFVLLGDGSYLMANSELATSVMLGRKIIVVLLDNRGFGCIDRLQRSTGGAGFNNLLDDTVHEAASNIDFAAHARSLGAGAEKVSDIAGLEAALARAKAADKSQLVVIETDPARSTQAGGAWWDVAVPEVSDRQEVHAARAAYEARLARRRGEAES